MLIPFTIVCKDKETVSTMDNNTMQEKQEKIEKEIENLYEENLENLLDGIIGDMIPIPPSPPTDEELTITFWDKLSFFWSLPLSIKWEVFKDHVKEHKLSYGSGCTAVAAVAVLNSYYFLYYKKRNG